MSTPAPAAVPVKKAVAPKKAAPKKKGIRMSVIKKAMKASKVPIMKCVIDCTLPIQDKIFDINAFVRTLIFFIQHDTYECCAFTTFQCIHNFLPCKKKISDFLLNNVGDLPCS